MSSGGKFRAVVLAGQRKGVINPLAMRFGTTSKCLIPINGRPLIEYVLATLGNHPLIEEIAVSIDGDSAQAVGEAAARAGGKVKVRLVEARDNLADSAIAGAEGAAGPILFTTGDNVLLAPSSIDVIANALASAEVVIAMARKESVLAAHPEAQRRFYEFSDGAYSNCNLYAVNGQGALKAAEVFREGGQFAKNPARIANAFGIGNVLLMRAKLVSLEAAIKRVGKRIGVKIIPVILADGSQAIDVDNDRTYGVTEELLARRGA
ncbi:hypothetical protein B2G71_06670 [Novosphingobium sp. PC22D]|uniref:NTP transferase domain-containing protein n=1 Tax=Novosphingobium sp. PC22D TaxID=1962403 RepID=UPI000BEFE1C5|nr:NTP transferase domain-containing protein [Novosphingobium sp. PC22D]PEQ13974.1 hypothetical protein B2G71_06670 [Novosphingobium sp. PC22D]